jgi:hypothetical protein
MKTVTITQGETTKYVVDLPDYPNPPWDSSIVITNAENVYEFDGTADGITHTFKISPTDSAGMEPGDYRARISVTDGTDIYSPYITRAQVIPDPTVPGNQMSHVEKVLFALNATIEGKATSDIANYSIRGRSIGRMSPSELLDWREKYMQFLQEEELAEDIANGGGAGAGIIRVRL